MRPSHVQRASFWNSPKDLVRFNSNAITSASEGFCRSAADGAGAEHRRECKDGGNLDQQFALPNAALTDAPTTADGAPGVWDCDPPSKAPTTVRWAA
jgi:hypothetical protein